MLHADVDGAGPRLVLVHGFTQTRRSWGPVGEDLARDHEVVRVDAPGHGRSAPVAAGLPGAGRLVAEVGGPATYVGYSMGGRVCLHTALDRPDVVRRLVLIGATGGIDDPGERAARVQADEALAADLERDGLDPFLERWLALPLFAGLSAEAADPAARRENTVTGLAASLRTTGTGTQAPLWDRVHAIDVPTLVVAGALDAKFAAAGRRLVDAIGPNATYAEVPGAGHTAHLEQPAAFLSLLRGWLADHPA